QAHNVAYNISAEWDDYRERYRWAVKGIEFLQQGAALNQNEPRLLFDIGFFSSHKLGQSDEKIQFRRLFREDDDFHARQAVHQRDNWLFGTEYYLMAERVAVNQGATSLPMA